MSPSNLTVEAWPVTAAGQAEENEDTVLVFQPADERQQRLSGNLYIVADGVGGGERGKIASQYAAQKVMQAYYASEEPDLGLRLRSALEAANLDLYHYAHSRPELVKVRTTLVAAAVRGEQAHIASVGDSRAYLVRDGQIRQISKDHTLVQQLIDEGAIAPEDAAAHPRRDVVMRTLGAEKQVQVDIFDLRLKGDDALLLCSDGLTTALEDADIARVIASSSPTNATEALVSRAADLGSKANISAITVLLRDGAPPQTMPMPHTWDGQPASFDAGPALAVPPVSLPTPDMDDTQPAQIPAQETRAAIQKPAPAEPLADYAIDPETGLPPIPPDQYEQPGRPAQPVYQPRIYRPQAQPALHRERSGVGVGLVLGVGFAVIVLVGGILLLLLNPFGWNLPFGIGGSQTEVAGTDELTDEQTTQAPSEEPTTPATTEPTEETAEPTEEPTPTVEPTAEPTIIPTPPNMTLITGGPFLRGVTDEEAESAVETCIQVTEGENCYREWFLDAQPVEQVTISPFFIDLTEVTNVAYYECVVAGICSLPDNTEFYADPAFGQHPVVYVDYDQARTYCEWAGKRLPTEAEWEKTARWDPNSQASFVYPWGNTFEEGIANTEAAGLGGLSSVQAFTRDVSPYGVFGMGGNASEWVQDWYFDSYDGLGTLNPVRLGMQPLPNPYRVGRGGSYQSLPHFVRAGHRLDIPPSTQVAWLGFRCAMDATAQPDAGNGEAADAEPAEETTNP